MGERGESSKSSHQPISLVEALEEKYSSSKNDVDLTSIAVEIYVPKNAPGQTSSGQLIIPQELSLHNAGIAFAGEEDRIKSCCENVTFLDLSENRICDWKEVLLLLDCIPKCAFLDLRLNPLSHDLTCLAEGKLYPNLKKLVLNNVQLPWHVITRLLNVFPKLEELHLSLNKYDTIDLEGTFSYPNVLIFHFNHNNISTWEHMARIGKVFPNLDTLFLLKNPIANLSHVKPEEAAQCFPNLKVLSVAETNIASWDDIVIFRHFPCLTQIRLQSLSFLEQYEPKLRRKLTLAYLPNISNLNGSLLHNNEREDSERAFIRHYMDKEPLPARYHELIAKYGQLDPLVDIDFRKKDTAHVTVHHGEKSFLQKIDLNQTLTKFKEVLQPKVNLSTKMMLLFHDDGEESLGMERMIYGERSLLRYGVKSGHKIYVEKKNIP